MKTALMIFPMELKRFGFCMVSFLKIALLFASNYIKNNEITSRIMKLLWLEVLSISLSLCLTSVDQFSSMRLRILLKFSCALEILRSSSRASSEKMPFDFTERSFNLRLKNDSNIAPEKVWRIRKAGVCFIDEIGRGSRELFSKLTAFLKLKTQPSAFQIRVGGVKGVISIHDQQEDVMFRDSMKKFESNHDKLEVLEYSKPIKLFLNRHAILLLSNFGVPDEVFMNLQFIELEKCMNALTDPEKSIEFVKASSEIINWGLIPPTRLSREPLFDEVLLSHAIELFSKIVDRAHIFVERGQVLMGVLDETNTLEYGEV